MKVLGISYGYHDATASLVIDGNVVMASGEERFTRQKHDSNFPAYAVRACLDAGNVKPEELDQVVFHEDPHAKFSRVLCAAMAPFPDTRREFVNSMKSWLGRKLWALSTISARLGVPPERISYLGHHFSHAVQAFMGSGFDESAILVVDAVGDWACSALYSGKWRDGRAKVDRILEVAYPNSLGLVYSAFTAWLGFSPNDSECSTMALAAFGQPVYADQVRRIISDAEDAGYQVDQSWFNFQRFYRGAVTDRFVETFGPPRDFRERLPFASFGPQCEVTEDAQRYADAAASVQLVLEERVLQLCDRLYQAFPSENLCYAGGVALNCVINTRIAESAPFRNIFIPPDPGDGGTAVATALYYTAQHNGAASFSKTYGPYLGPTFDESRDAEIVDEIDITHVRAYVKRSVQSAPEKRWRRQSFDDQDALCEETAQRLQRGQIVGWYQGRAELGPRALGNRSLLARADADGPALRLSRAVKERATFRPYALSISPDEAERLLDLGKLPVRATRWMQFAVRVRPEVHDSLRCGLHVNGTTRVQVCQEADNPLFHRLLERYRAISGVGALINTSFNASGYPIVSTPTDALAMFARTDMDALVLNNTLIWKERDVD
jgi:carbamoyltransferase